jgi:hypothetical protein
MIYPFLLKQNMKQKQFLSTVGVGVTAPYPLDCAANVFQVGLTWALGGAPVFNIEVCGEDILAGRTPVWITIPALTGISANGSGVLNNPVTGLRINVTSGTGQVTLNINQTKIT